MRVCEYIIHNKRSCPRAVKGLDYIGTQKHLSGPLALFDLVMSVAKVNHRCTAGESDTSCFVGTSSLPYTAYQGVSYGIGFGSAVRVWERVDRRFRRLMQGGGGIIKGDDGYTASSYLKCITVSYVSDSRREGVV